MWNKEISRTELWKRARQADIRFREKVKLRTYGQTKLERWKVSRPYRRHCINNELKNGKNGFI